MRRRTSAFTLVEMLVVVAIIMVLMALLLPSMVRTKELARLAVCTSNMRQLGLGVMYYAEANNQFFPAAMGPQKSNGLGTGWINSEWRNNSDDQDWWAVTNAVTTGTLFPYLNAPKVYVCPSFAQVCGHANPIYSYSMSSNLGPLYNDSGPTRIYRLAKVARPYTTMVLTEEDTWLVPYFSNDSLNDSRFCMDSIPEDNIATYHRPPSGDINNGSSNIVCADAHVELIRLKHNVSDITAFRDKYYYGR